MTYTLFCNTRESFLCVEHTELVRLGVADKISSQSHQHGAWVYLDDEDDAPLFEKEKASRNEVVEIVDVYDDWNPIRTYPKYKV